MSEIILEAMHSGILKLGEYEIECYVLENELRVLAQNKVVYLISGGRDSGDLGRYLRAKSIHNFLPDKFKGGKYKYNVHKFRAGNRIVYGYAGEDIVDICNAYLKARTNGTLQVSQANIAERADIFIQACAKTGINAVIDEATGYEYFKMANDLQIKLQAFIIEGYREWTLTFPKEFFMQLYRLEGIRAPIPVRPYPKRFGRYVMRFVYDTLDPDIADWLRANNPNPESKRHHFQKFSDFGYRKLIDQLMSVLGIMKASTTIEIFKENLARAFPNARTQRIKRRQIKKRKKLIEAGQEELFEFKYL